MIGGSNRYEFLPRDMERISGSMNESIIIFAASDEKYAQHLAVMVASVCANHRTNEKLEFYIVDGNISNESKDKIRVLTEVFGAAIEFLPLDTNLFSGFPTPAYLSTAAYYRLIIPDLVDASIKKGIYLDCDIIVRNDVSELWAIDLGDALFAAVSDPGGAPQFLLLQSEAKYFNSGVMVIDMDNWRSCRLSQRLLQYVVNHATEIVLADQDALNGVVATENLIWIELHPRWNVLGMEDEYEHWHYRNSAFGSEDFTDALEKPAIVHFTGACKPWQYGSRHPYLPEYYKNLAFTEWRNYRPEIPEYIAQLGNLPIVEDEQGQQIRFVGWAKPEKGAVWTIRKEVLLLLGCLPTGNYEILMKCIPFLAPGIQEQRLIAWDDQECIGDFSIDKLTEVRLIIKSTDITAPKVIRFHLPNAVSPRSMGVSEDIRRLGISVRSLHLAMDGKTNY